MFALKLLAVGPNPALQKVLSFEQELALGGVNRAVSAEQYVGGKGQGVALALQRWAPGSSSVAHFLGGGTGEYVETSMRDAGINQLVQHTAATTRICTTLLDVGGRSTELIEPSGKVTPEELQGLIDQLKKLDPAEYGGVALCGTTPPGADSLYAEAAAEMSPGVLLMVDAFKTGDVSKLLTTGRVDVLKLNVDEVKALTGTSSAEEAAAKLLGGAQAHLRRPGALLALTDGPRPARLFSKHASWLLHVPQIECVNAIGAGDVCTAVFLHSLMTSLGALRTTESDNSESDSPLAHLDGDAAAEAFSWGLAAACARCAHQKPSAFTREEAAVIKADLRIETSESVVI